LSRGSWKGKLGLDESWSTIHSGPEVLIFRAAGDNGRGDSGAEIFRCKLRRFMDSPVSRKGAKYAKVAKQRFSSSGPLATMAGAIPELRYSAASFDDGSFLAEASGMGGRPSKADCC
jgi:hypothetical protein